MANETTSTLSAVAKTFYLRTLLERLNANYVHGQFADEGKVIVLPNGAKTAEWRRWEALAAATSALTEGTTPAGNNHSVTQVTATPAQYGDFTIYSDVLELASIDPILVAMAEVFGDQAGDTLDQVCRDILAAGTNIQYADGVADRASVAITNKMTANEFEKALRTLKTAKVPRFVDNLGGSYVALVHPKTVYDLRNDADWRSAAEYAGSTAIYNGEVGRYAGFRCIETPNTKIFSAAGSGGIDVYATLCFGQHWYGKTKFAASPGGVQMMANGGEMVDFFVKPAGSSGSADPLNQRGSVGWKASHKTVILNQNCGLRIEHAVTA